MPGYRRQLTTENLTAHLRLSQKTSLTSPTSLLIRLPERNFNLGCICVAQRKNPPVKGG